jgi:hypothetical protein
MIKSICAITASSQRVVEFITIGTIADLRNDFSGFLGGSIVPVRNLVVTHLGRYVNSGNSQSHSLTLWNETDSVIVAQTTIVCAGAPVGFKYNTLRTAVLLVAGKNYVLTSEEFSGGDTWANYDSSLSYSDDIFAPVSCYSGSPTSGFNFDAIDSMYVPLNLKYY